MASMGIAVNNDLYKTMAPDEDMSTIGGNGRYTVDMTARMAVGGDAIPSGAARILPDNLLPGSEPSDGGGTPRRVSAGGVAPFQTVGATPPKSFTELRESGIVASAHPAPAVSPKDEAIQHKVAWMRQVPGALELAANPEMQRVLEANYQQHGDHNQLMRGCSRCHNVVQEISRIVASAAGSGPGPQPVAPARIVQPLAPAVRTAQLPASSPTPAPESKATNWWLYIVIGILVLVVVGAVWAWSSSPQAPSAFPAPPTATSTLGAGTFTATAVPAAPAAAAPVAAPAVVISGPSIPAVAASQAAPMNLGMPVSHLAQALAALSS